MTIAAVLTANAPAAISTVLVMGAAAEEICAKACAMPAEKFRPGTHFVASLRDGERIIDEILAGCEAEGKIALHCHGNPLITQAALELLEKCGARIAAPEELALREAAELYPRDTLAQEAHVYRCLAPSMRACRLINACAIRDAAGSLTREKAKRMLEMSKIATRLFGISRIAIVGAPNAGKSTLINRLAGEQVAIVTDVRGTTRDWVSARATIGDFSVEFIDTAGLDSSLTSHLDTAGQKKTVEIAAGCELVIALLEAENAEKQLEMITEAAGGKTILPVLNKSDLSQAADSAYLHISALTGENIDLLINAITKALEPEPLAEDEPICFTLRQKELVRRIASGEKAAPLREELLHGNPAMKNDLNALLRNPASLVE